MNKNAAIKLARYHKFTRIELYEILVEALNTFNDEYWKKPNKVNPIFDNGAYFNLCIKWVGYEEGVNDSDISAEPVAVRVIENFGKFSKIQLPKKKKAEIKIKCSEKPQL